MAYLTNIKEKTASTRPGAGFNITYPPHAFHMLVRTSTVGARGTKKTKLPDDRAEAHTIHSRCKTWVCFVRKAEMNINICTNSIVLEIPLQIN